MKRALTALVLLLAVPAAAQETKRPELSLEPSSLSFTGAGTESFNIVNRDNVANVNAVSGPTFGTAVGYLPGREVQFGIRYLFGQ